MNITVGNLNSRRPVGFKKPRTYLKGEYFSDMKELRIYGNIRNPQTRKDEFKNEPPKFITYLTLALQNISEIMGKDKECDLSGKKTVAAVKDLLQKKGKLREIASFLWTHRAENPSRDFERDFEQFAIDLVVKLWELRNMFVHYGQANASKVLIVPPEFRRFVEGELFESARERAMGPGRKSEKVYKLRLFVPNNDARTRYEFTRKGMIFLVCLALYRHDAVEFIAQFPDLQLPPREWEMEKGVKTRPSEAELVALRKKGGSVKAIIDAFTYYSMRSSRTDIDVQNSDYLNFANILLYLNKVPMASYNYLSLDEEVEKVLEAAEDAKDKPMPESEENRRFRYLLQARRKDRFLTLALAFIEDFKVLDCLRFKRLDITVRPERSKYLFGRIPEGATNEFGDPISDANGMDRHYVIKDGAAAFEYIPLEKEHYGTVKISSLRGAISEDEILRLLLAHFSNKDQREKTPNAVLREYLSAYHRILERMINAPDTDSLSLDDETFRKDFKVVSGKDDEALTKERFVEEMKPFFSASITRYFVGDAMVPSVPELQRRLNRRLTVAQGRAEDFLLKLDKLTEWRSLDEAARKEAGFPICAVGELRYPPRTCKITDAQLVRWVLKYINLHLTASEKYRQLPRYARHRGFKDVEFQLLHTDIGRFGIDPLNLWRTLEKRESLNAQGGPLEALKDRERELFQAEQRRCRGKFDKNHRPLRVGHTLTMLAAAAAELYADWCSQLQDAWCGVLTSEDAELLPYACRQYGVKTGQPLDREAMVKTVLGIDLANWSNAYDYARGENFKGRKLEDAADLKAVQIPIPNQLAIRCMKRPVDGGRFLFGPAFRVFTAYEDGKMSLRGYYDVSPLIEYVKQHKKSGAEVIPGVKGVEVRGGQEFDETQGGIGKNPPTKVEFTRSEVNKAIQSIQLAERQDKILLACAKKYWEKYMADEVTSTEKNKVEMFRLSEATDIRQFFDTPILDEVNGVRIWMMPNDFARPAFGVVTTHIKELVKVPLKEFDGPVKPNAKGEYSFYDLWLALRTLQRREANLRNEYLPVTIDFDEAVAVPEELEKLPKDDPEKLPKTLAWCNEKLRKRNSNPLTAEEYFAVCEFETRLRHPLQKRKDGTIVTLCTFDSAPALAVFRRFGFLNAQDEFKFGLK